MGAINSISDNLFRRVFAVYVAVSVLIFLFETLIVYDEARQEIAVDLERTHEIFGDSLSHAVWNLDAAQIDLTLASVLRTRVIRRARIVDASGSILRDRSAPDAGAATPFGLLPGSTLSSNRAIRHESRRGLVDLGSLELHSNDAVIYDRLKVTIAMTAISALLKAALLLVLFKVFFHLTLSRPLLHIARQAASIDPRQVGGRRLPVKSGVPDELDVISSALNRLLDAMDRALQQQDELYRGLELKMEQLKLAQADLIEAEKLASLGSLVAGVAHEINTPVGLGYTGATHFSDLVAEIDRSFRADALERPQFEAFLADSKELARSICSSLERAAALVRSFTMVAVDQGVSELRWFSPSAYVQDVVLTHQTVLRRAGIALAVECDPDFQVYSDPGAWAQVLSNLINNAVIHGFGSDRPDARIAVKVGCGNGWVDLRFEDNGRGMPADVARRIYEPLFTTNRQQGGSGLGMHIVFNLVTQRLQGSIGLTTAPGQGAAFHIRLPQVHEPRTPPSGDACVPPS